MKQKIENTYRFIVFLVMFFIHFSFTVNAQEIDANGEESHSLVLQAVYPAAVKLEYIYNYRIPFMQGESPLTEGNNLNFGIMLDLTPISVNGHASLTWTPVAFLEFSTGGRVGTGWKINLFGEKLYGIGLNRPGENGFAEHSGSAFDGVIGKFHFGGAFQFDLAAVFPGEWNHVIFRTYHEINYHAYSGARSGESWYFEHLTSENVNGYNYYSNYIIGYQMPLVLNMVGIMAEAQRNFYDIPDKRVWGGDLIQWTISPILNFAVNDQIDIMVITQFQTKRNYIEPDHKDIYYRNLTVDRSNPQSFKFLQAAAVLTYRF